MNLSTNLSENIKTAKELFPIGKSFDLITRDLYLGDTKAFFMGVNGLIKTEILQQIFSDLQNPLYTKDSVVENITHYMSAKIGYAQVQLSDNWEDIARQVVSGPILLFIDGFSQCIIIDARTYPVRSIAEPDTEHVIKGARDGFVETLLFNANLIRRRIRSPKLTFEIVSIGKDSKTDVSITYVEGLADKKLFSDIKKALQNLDISCLTMGSKSLEELLLRKRWYNPLPSMHSTERPDVACSYLMEGHILLLVDNSPLALILPSTFFQFTQNPDDYYSSPFVGNYFRLVRFSCIFISLLLMPTYLLLTTHFPELAKQYHLLSTDLNRWELFVYILAVEFVLDLFKYSSVHSPGRFSGSLSIIGGLIIGDIAIDLNWASIEILFYAAITLLTSLSLTSVEFADGLRIYRLFLIVITGFLGIPGFCVGLALILISLATTPTFGKMSYLWPLFPFNGKALGTLLFRYPTTKAQPAKAWNRQPKE